MQNNLFDDIDICCYLAIAEKEVSQKIVDDEIYLSSKNHGILSNIAELLSYCGFFVTYNVFKHDVIVVACH